MLRNILKKTNSTHVSSFQESNQAIFNREKARFIGASFVSPEALMVFLDIDVAISFLTIENIMTWTKKGKQVL